MNNKKQDNLHKGESAAKILDFKISMPVFRQVIIDAMEEYAAPLHKHIEELEAERDKYRVALEKIVGLDARSDDRPGLYEATQIAYEVLSEAEQALNSKEVGE